MVRVGGILKNTLTVGALTAFSRVLGLVREMMQSRLIGAGVEQSAFALAFALPNMARKLFGEGALTAAFVPVFKGEVARGDIEAARRLANAVMTTVLALLASVVTLALIVLTHCLGADLSPRAALIVRLVRILAPYMVFICGAALGMGVMNALGRFAAGAFMPVLLNVVWCLALALLCFFPSWNLEMRVQFVCWAILLGGLVQMLFLFVCMARRGYPFRFRFAGFADPKIRAVWRNTAIAALGAGAIQLNYMLDQVLAQLASPWAAGVIGYAERLMDLPLGIVGVAFGTVLLPTFAGFFAKDDFDGARKALSASAVQLMVVMVPAAAGLCVLSREVTCVIYEGHAFDALATLRVSRALAVYALGLGFFGWQKAIVPWFQAQGDMRTPLRVSVVTVVINATLNVLAVVLLPEAWRHVGLAASTVLCSLIGCLLLTTAARRRNGSLGLRALVGPIVRILIAASAMALALLGLRPLLKSLPAFVALAAEVLAGLLVYALTAWRLGLRLNRRA